MLRLPHSETDRKAHGSQDNEENEETYPTLSARRSRMVNGFFRLCEAAILVSQDIQVNEQPN